MDKKIKKDTTSGEEMSLAQTIPQNKEIVTVDNDPASQVEFAQKAAKSLMVVIDATKPLTMQGKRYLYFEHWQTIARFFNTTVGIESTTKDTNGYIAKAVVYNKDGVVIGGAEASCMKDEQNWKGKPDFQLRSMAQTRAMSKALRSMYGFVAVLAGVEATPAEEMKGIEQSEAYPPTEKQIEFIKGLMEQKQVDEAWVIGQGFDLKNLTGGKGGTASELIEFLKNYIPEQAQVRVENQMDFTPKGQTPDIALGMRIDKCGSLASLDLVAKEIFLALKNGKITKGQFEILKDIGSKRREELAEKEGIVTGANITF